MERLKQRKADAQKALQTFSEILNEPYSVIVRDAAIQRFEYSFEAAWKFLKEYLRVKEGVVCHAPKACFREAQSAGLLNEEETLLCLEMTDDRNMTSHTYREEIANLLYGKRETYLTLMQKLLNACRVEQ